MVRKIINSAVITAVAFAALCAGFVTAAKVGSGERVSIVVDAGHGAPDGGAVGVTGTQEKDINLAIAKKLEETLEAKGIAVIMTRNDDNGIWDNPNDTIRRKKLSDMYNRRDIIDKSNADLFISIHMNSFTDKTASGLRIFYDRNHAEGEEIAELIQDSIAAATGAVTEAVKTADEKLFLMKSSPMPAVLVECGFISNESEEEKLKNDEYQSKIAWAIAESVEKYYKNID